MPRSAEHWDTRIGKRLRLCDLHVLLTVVQRGSMAKAAQHLAVSQPAISKAISDLEHTLGVQLLDRGPRGVEPTLYGSALVRRGLTVFDELRQGVGEIEFMADPTVGEVRVGCAEWVLATLLPPVIEQLSGQHPGVIVHVVQMNPVTLEIRELRERNIDLLIGRKGAFAEDDLNAEILVDDPLIVVAGAQSHWARRRKIELADLVSQKWILYPANSLVAARVENAFRARDLAPPRAKVTTHSHYLRDILLTTGDYLTVIPVSMLRVYNRKHVTVRALPVDLGIQSTPMTIFTLKNRTLSPVTELFMTCVRTTVKSMQSGNEMT
jgi:DNA-binding transcriptional LysR family regulator